MSDSSSRAYVQSLLGHINQLEAELNETTRIKKLFGATLEKIGIFRVNDQNGDFDSHRCATCGEPKYRHDLKEACPKYGEAGAPGQDSFKPQAPID